MGKFIIESLKDEKINNSIKLDDVSFAFHQDIQDLIIVLKELTGVLRNIKP